MGRPPASAEIAVLIEQLVIENRSWGYKRIQGIRCQPDAPGGKWAGLDRTIAALRLHGLLVVDDMTASPQWTTGQHARQDEVRQALLTSPLLTSTELDHGSGVILSTRHA